MQATLHWVSLFLNIKHASPVESAAAGLRGCVEMLAVVTSYEGLLAACHYSVVTIIIARVFIFHLIIIVSSTNKYKLNAALSRHCLPDTHRAVLFTFVSIHRNRICYFVFYQIQISRVFSPTCGVWSAANRRLGTVPLTTRCVPWSQAVTSRDVEGGWLLLLLLPEHRLPLGRAAARVTTGHQWGQY